MWIELTKQGDKTWKKCYNIVRYYAALKDERHRISETAESGELKEVSGHDMGKRRNHAQGRN